MKTPYLLIAGDDFYPEPGTNNWLGCFETEKAALDFIVKYKINSDWYEIVNLEDYIYGNQTNSGLS